MSEDNPYYNRPVCTPDGRWLYGQEADEYRSNLKYFNQRAKAHGMPEIEIHEQPMILPRIFATVIILLALSFILGVIWKHHILSSPEIPSSTRPTTTTVR